MLDLSCGVLSAQVRDKAKNELASSKADINGEELLWGFSAALTCIA